MDNNYLSRLKSLFSKTVSNQDYLEEVKVSDNVQELLENRYFVNLFNGKENTYKQLCKRVSRVVAATELYHYSQKTEQAGKQGPVGQAGSGRMCKTGHCRPACSEPPCYRSGRIRHDPAHAGAGSEQIPQPFRPCLAGSAPAGIRPGPAGCQSCWKPP